MHDKSISREVERKGGFGLLSLTKEDVDEDDGVLLLPPLAAGSRRSTTQSATEEEDRRYFIGKCGRLALLHASFVGALCCVCVCVVGR